MANFDDRLKDYVQINERIVKFYDEHPEGSLQSEMILRTDTVVVMKAWAYRTPDDTKPGIGHSSCPIPGLTTYTKNSEIENAETSAWGRAIAALGFEVKRGIATQHEIDMKRTETPPPALGPQNTGQYVGRPQIEVLMRSAIAKMGKGNGTFQIAMWTKELGCTSETTTPDQLKELLQRVTDWSPEQREPGDEPPSTNFELAEQIVKDANQSVRDQQAGAPTITEKQGNRLYMIAKTAGRDLPSILQHFGFTDKLQIPSSKTSPLYDEICAEAGRQPDGLLDDKDIEF